MQSLNKWLAGIGLVATLFSGDPVLAEPAKQASACQLGFELRQAFGLGPIQLAVLGVDSRVHAQLSAAATSYCEKNRGVIEPLLDAVRSARQVVRRQYELGADPQQAEQTLVSAINALSQAVGSDSSILTDLLTAQQNTLRRAIIDQFPVDPQIVSLALSGEQATSALDAQRTRDRVVRHNRSRKNPGLVRDAFTDYQADLGLLLTADQWDQFQSTDEQIQRAISSANADEEGLCGSGAPGGEKQPHERRASSDHVGRRGLLKSWKGLIAGLFLVIPGVGLIIGRIKFSS